MDGQAPRIKTLKITMLLRLIRYWRAARHALAVATCGAPRSPIYTLSLFQFVFTRVNSR
jgi:hypothetical protein